MEENLIKAGSFAIIQRQNYTKLQKIKENCTVTLGKDIINVDSVLGHRYEETFRMVLKPGTRRVYMLEEVSQLTLTNIKQIEESGTDNRDIIDDGTSQGLSKTEIEDLRDQALSSNDIVQKLVENSKTFSSKTEYSQEKYLKKKEKKYFEYIQVRKPSIRLVAQMFYRQDPNKTLGLRIDDLSQLLTYANVQSDGNYLLYDSGTSGLVAASILHAVGRDTPGHLVHAHPGNECQKSALLAMNFPAEQLERCVNVNLYSVLRCFYQNDAELDTETDGPKRKQTNDDTSAQPKKRPTWQIENESACRVLREKVDGVIIVAKEHPVSITRELVPFLRGGRCVVVFSLTREPLQDLYFYLKERTDFIAVNVSNSFVRNYQVLPERTHPEVIMNFGGYLLSAYKLNV
ncbi:tRNA (adenine(58)-N(1))-methyltransferase non-catalytic subunit TRM6 [Photinus pyralis]|nr:tRNA (adenine(58)-N(1))-methyltransferase non-catalytic subunit TRM6 [Photinus pyralis]